MEGTEGTEVMMVTGDMMAMESTGPATVPTMTIPMPITTITIGIRAIIPANAIVAVTTIVIAATATIATIAADTRPA